MKALKKTRIKGVQKHEDVISEWPPPWDVCCLRGKLAVCEEGAEEVAPPVGEGAPQGDPHLLVGHVQVHLQEIEGRN